MDWSLKRPVRTHAKASLAHPAQSAPAVGWAPSPFQYEVGIADLTIGILGLGAFRASYGFRLATTARSSLQGHRQLNCAKFAQLFEQLSISLTIFARQRRPTHIRNRRIATIVKLIDTSPVSQQQINHLSLVGLNC